MPKTRHGTENGLTLQHYGRGWPRRSAASERRGRVQLEVRLTAFAKASAVKKPDATYDRTSATTKTRRHEAILLGLRAFVVSWLHFIVRCLRLCLRGPRVQ